MSDRVRSSSAGGARGDSGLSRVSGWVEPPCSAQLGRPEWVRNRGGACPSRKALTDRETSGRGCSGLSQGQRAVEAGVAERLADRPSREYSRGCFSKMAERLGRDGEGVRLSPDVHGAGYQVRGLGVAGVGRGGWRWWLSDLIGGVWRSTESVALERDSREKEEHFFGGRRGWFSKVLTIME